MLNICGFKIDNKDVDRLAKALATVTLDNQDEAMDAFLVTLDAIHSLVTLYQQELADVSDGTILFSKKYL